MIRLSRGCTVCLAALVCATLFSAAGAQSPNPPQPPERPGQPRGPRPAPTNIKALPKNISGDDLSKLMHQYEGDLGVKCEFCHAQNQTTKRNDFASDANPVKDVARYMIVMTADLNDKYLTEMPDRRYADPITCGTCHRGEKHPSIFVPKPQIRENRPSGPSPASPSPASPAAAPQ